jgi:hypothetical protein
MEENRICVNSYGDEGYALVDLPIGKAEELRDSLIAALESVE